MPWIALGVVVVLAIALISVYNALVSKRVACQAAWSQIDVQLKRRYDLIPNLVETAKGYLKHEKGTLEAVIQARNQALNAAGKAAATPGDPQAMGNLKTAEAGLSGALGKLFALAESYPDLKANQTMLSLMEELTSTENKISFARQAYNDAVMEYNIGREKFPNVLLAASFGFTAAALLELKALRSVKNRK